MATKARRDPGGYHRILFCTDFSESAAQAFEYAVAFARQSGAKIEIIHVLTLHDADPAVAEGKLPKVGAEAGDLVDGRRMVRAMSGEIGIVHAARDAGADLIVMGTHGRKGLRHAFLGSVAERVVQLASCPVLTVRPKGHTFEAP